MKKNNKNIKVSTNRDTRNNTNNNKVVQRLEKEFHQSTVKRDGTLKAADQWVTDILSDLPDDAIYSTAITNY